MGYMRHHTIIVTSWNAKELAKAREVAVKKFDTLVSPIVDGKINSYASFFIAPDGSKEGWDVSDEHDTKRKEYCHWLESQREDDGSSYLKWVEVQFGDDDFETMIVRDGDEYLRNKEE